MWRALETCRAFSKQVGVVGGETGRFALWRGAEGGWHGFVGGDVQDDDMLASGGDGREETPSGGAVGRSN